MFDCSQVYCTPLPDTRASPDLFPQAAPPPAALPTLEPPSYHPHRTSLNPSELTSTTSGSDNERVFSSGDEDSMGFQSDTAYDSGIMRATMNSDSDLSGHERERLFDNSLVSETTKQSLLPLKELIPCDSFSELPQHGHERTSLDGLDSLSTPKDDQSSNSEAVNYFTTPVAAQKSQSQLNDFPSSPPSTPYREAVHYEPHPKELLTTERDSMAFPVSELWDDEACPASPSDESFGSLELPQPSLQRPIRPAATAHQHSPAPNRRGFDEIREEKRMSIFDWSEQQRSDRDSLTGSSPRPRTVHSRQANDGRGGRALGRRAPNALHLRSQSVPAAKESYLDSDPAFPPAKFGTWGLGNKGVSEEWTDDFEFDEPEDNDVQNSFERLGPGMKVPQAIIDRQASVHGQFGQVQEFMLLVEELKRLRHQGNLLDLMGGPSHHLWEDAENIINLATLNEDDEEFIVPQSPGFSNGFDDFDVEPVLSRPWQQGSPENAEDSKGLLNVTLNSAPVTPASGRPRGESLAQAKNFLQTIHQNRSGIESSPFEDRSHPPKLPFDTQDLRDLVIRAGVATRALKDIVRKAEGVFTSPDRPRKEPQDPPFSQIFKRPESVSPTSRKSGLAKSTSVNSHMDGSLAGRSNEADRLGQMNVMTMV
jgi:Septation protein etd1